MYPLCVYTHTFAFSRIQKLTMRNIHGETRKLHSFCQSSSFVEICTCKMHHLFSYVYALLGVLLFIQLIRYHCAQNNSIPVMLWGLPGFIFVEKSPLHFKRATSFSKHWLTLQVWCVNRIIVCPYNHRN